MAADWTRRYKCERQREGGGYHRWMMVSYFGGSSCRKFGLEGIFTLLGCYNGRGGGGPRNEVAQQYGCSHYKGNMGYVLINF